MAELSSSTPSRAPEPGPRKDYEAPRITFRESLEATAAICPPPNGKGAFPCLIGQS